MLAMRARLRWAVPWELRGRRGREGVDGGGAEIVLFLPGAASSLARTLIFIFWRSDLRRRTSKRNRDQYCTRNFE